MTQKTTLFGQVTINAYKEATADNPSNRKLFNDVHTKLMDGYSPEHYVNALFQLPHDRTPDIYDAFTFGQLHQEIMLGNILVKKIRIGTEPYPDKCLEENRAALQNLPSPFSAEVWNGHAPNDGFIHWDSPFNVKHISYLDKHSIFKLEPHPNFREERITTCVDYHSISSIPLEIGQTHPETTYFHIETESGLARWPYRDEYIWIFLCMYSVSRHAKENRWAEYGFDEDDEDDEDSSS